MVLLLRAALVLALSARAATAESGMCTTIAMGKRATVDGSTIVTHNADCKNCDYRVSRTPARKHAPGSNATILKYRAEYPRYVTEERGATWRGERLSGPHVDAWNSTEVRIFCVSF